VTADSTGMAAVETGMAPLVQGVQKTSPRLEKRFLDCRLVAPGKEKVKKPAGLKTRPSWWRRDCVVERNCRSSTGLPPSNLTGALTGYYFVRRRRTCKEWNGTREVNVGSQLAFHDVGMKPGEVSHCQRGA
jgi:hypothetical protein